MIQRGYVMSAFGESYTVPIPKLTDCRTKSLSVDNFTGIAISAVISKVFEYCILDRFQSFLSTVDNQFGLKKRALAALTLFLLYVVKSKNSIQEEARSICVLLIYLKLSVKLITMLY